MPNGVYYRTDSLLFISLFGSNKASLDTKGKYFIRVSCAPIYGTCGCFFTFGGRKQIFCDFESDL